MRQATRRPDGTLALAQINRANDDLRRYEMFRSGFSVTDIATQETIDPKIVEASLRRGRALYEVEQGIRLRNLKYESAIENEEIRKAVRRKVTTKIVDAVDRLLDGTRTAVQVNRETGDVTLKEFTDPEVIAMGIDAASKMISLQERPQPSQTVVNIQNNQGDGTIRSSETSFEERLERIRSQQEGRPVERDEENVPMSRQVIETTAVEVPGDRSAEDTEENLF